MLRRQAARVEEVRSVLCSEAGTDGGYDRSIPLSYAVAHHMLEGAESAAERHDRCALAWFRRAEPDLSPWVVTTDAGPFLAVMPRAEHYRVSTISETPHVLLAPELPAAPAHLQRSLAAAVAHADGAGFGALVGGHARVVCMLRHRVVGETLDSWTTSRLPGTVFLDVVGDPLVFGRDLVHEAGHGWLNEALLAARVTLPDEAAYPSPWKRRLRPAYGFLHACWAFPLTMLYAATVLPVAHGRGRRHLDAYLAQQARLLASTTRDHARALGLVSDSSLADRLHAVHEAALCL